MTSHELNQFFRPLNSHMQIADSEYAQTAVCISMADALARNTNHSLYIIDYNRKISFMYRLTPCFSAAVHRKKCDIRVMPSILRWFHLTK